MNSETGAESKGDTTVLIVGGIGMLAYLVIYLSEMVSLVRAPPDNNDVGRESEGEVIVSEVSNFWVSASVVMITIFMAFSVAYAVEPLWRMVAVC